MNKQITQLAEQAGLYVDLNGRPYPKSMSAEECIAAYQKFAELIVRELSAVANHFSDGHEVRQFDDSKRYLYFVDIGKVILEHFGVEE